MKSFKFLFSIVIASMVVVFTSCDPNEDPLSDQDVRDNYLGTWKVQESGKGKVTYEVEITADPDNSVQVLINNFYDYNIKPYAIVTASTITLPSQDFAKSLQIHGSGTLSQEKITWTYYVNNGADLDTIHSVYTKL
jgi:hypothetical protein